MKNYALRNVLEALVIVTTITKITTLAIYNIKKKQEITIINVHHQGI